MNFNTTDAMQLVFGDDENAGYFVNGALLGGIGTFFACLYFQRKGTKTPEGYNEVAPAWAYEANAYLTATWTTLAFVTALLDCILLMSSEMMDSEEVLHVKNHCDYFVLGAVFGITAKDFILFFTTPDPVLLVHHLATMSILWFLSFSTSFKHLLRLSTFSVIVTEMGSACYCCYVMWNYKTLYAWGMTLSNILLFCHVAYMFVLHTWGGSWDEAEPVIVITALFCNGLLIGRQLVLYFSLAGDKRAEVKKD